MSSIQSWLRLSVILVKALKLPFGHLQNEGVGLCSPRYYQPQQQAGSHLSQTKTESLLSYC